MDDKLLLPPGCSLNNLHALRDALTTEINNETKQQSPPKDSTTTATATTNLPRAEGGVCSTPFSTTGNKNTIQGKRTLSYNALTTTVFFISDRALHFTSTNNCRFGDSL